MKYNPATQLGLHWAAYVEVRDSYDWDPAAPAPYETPLFDGDRVELGPDAEVEFVVLPREGTGG